jgi:molecular chaperone GrpE (heat shock protein)
MRRIRDLDVEKAKDFGIQRFAKDILEVADNLARCIENVPKEGLGILTLYYL